MQSDNPEIDPSIFEKDQEFELTFRLANLVSDYSNALVTIQQYEENNSSEAKAGRERQFRESQQFKSIEDMIGSVFSAEIVNMTVEEIGNPTNKEEYITAISKRETAIDQLVGYTFGYQQYMHTNLEAVFDDDLEALTAAWEATWNRLKQAIGTQQTGHLADTAALFDLLIAEKYGPVYDGSDSLRGPIVSQDIAARAFYETMEDHLPRSILKRRSGDDWS